MVDFGQDSTSDDWAFYLCIYPMTNTFMISMMFSMVVIDPTRKDRRNMKRNATNIPIRTPSSKVHIR
jgi:hypothetical protein